ncbi:hypothetical protein CHH27_04025 [Labrenzia sp. VG12]|nr:hypothetical protein CHH27_04025 [Labrenzia sp. VG12]
MWWETRTIIERKGDASRILSLPKQGDNAGPVVVNGPSSLAKQLVRNLLRNYDSCKTGTEQVCFSLADCGRRFAIYILT